MAFVTFQQSDFPWISSQQLGVVPDYYARMMHVSSQQGSPQYQFCENLDGSGYAAPTSGQYMIIEGVAADGTQLHGKIQSVNLTSNTVTLDSSADAGQTLNKSFQIVYWGTDNTTALTAASQQAANLGAALLINWNPNAALINNKNLDNGIPTCSGTLVMGNITISCDLMGSGRNGAALVFGDARIGGLQLGNPYLTIKDLFFVSCNASRTLGSVVPIQATNALIDTGGHLDPKIDTLRVLNADWIFDGSSLKVQKVHANAHRKFFYGTIPTGQGAVRWFGNCVCYNKTTDFGSLNMDAFDCSLGNRISVDACDFGVGNRFIVLDQVTASIKITNSHAERYQQILYCAPTMVASGKTPIMFFRGNDYSSAQGDTVLPAFDIQTLDPDVIIEVNDRIWWPANAAGPVVKISGAGHLRFSGGSIGAVQQNTGTAFYLAQAADTSNFKGKVLVAGVAISGMQNIFGGSSGNSGFKMTEDNFMWNNFSSDINTNLVDPAYVLPTSGDPPFLGLDINGATRGGMAPLWEGTFQANGTSGETCFKSIRIPSSWWGSQAPYGHIRVNVWSTRTGSAGTVNAIVRFNGTAGVSATGQLLNQSISTSNTSATNPFTLLIINPGTLASPGVQVSGNSNGNQGVINLSLQVLSVSALLNDTYFNFNATVTSTDTITVYYSIEFVRPPAIIQA